MRPKNAAINLEPIPEREKKEGKKYARFVLQRKGLVYILCVASTTFARTTTQNRETVKVVADPSSSFSSFSAAGPSRFSEVRSFSAFSLDVINYPRLICAKCDSKEKKKERRKRPREDDEPKAFCHGRRCYGCGREETVVYVVVSRRRRRLPPRSSTKKTRD